MHFNTENFMEFCKATPSYTGIRNTKELEERPHNKFPRKRKKEKTKKETRSNINPPPFEKENSLLCTPRRNHIGHKEKNTPNHNITTRIKFLSLQIKYAALDRIQLYHPIYSFSTSSRFPSCVPACPSISRRSFVSWPSYLFR